jgi:NADH:ubiquinone oxidoreductase subunit 4 (subunit M)
VPLLACILWIGIYPAPVLRRMEASAEQVISTVRVNSQPHRAARPERPMGGH